MAVHPASISPRDIHHIAQRLARLEAGDLIGRDQYLAALRTRSQLAARVRGVFAQCDLVVVPTTVSTAPPLDHIDRPVDGHEVNWPDVSARTVALWNVTGLPALSLPIGTGDDGLPVGMQIVGPPHGDERCLALAQLVERSVVNAM